jgi:hypothetical protein
MTAVYAGAFGNREQFVFHRSVLDKFLSIVRDTCPGLAPEVRHHALYEPAAIDIEMRDLRAPRWAQPDAIAYAVADGVTKMINLGPGRGKTFVFNSVAFKIQRRVAMILRAQYVKKWIADIKSAHMATDEDMFVVAGNKDDKEGAMEKLSRLMKEAKDGTLTAKYILISNATYRNYLKLYEDSNGSIKNSGFPYSPHELMEALGVGLLGIDEVHQDFHFNHRAIIYNHVPKLVCLSGTLDPDNVFKDEVVRLTFPVRERFTEPTPEPYLRVKALQYSFANPHMIKFKNRGRPEYSQTALEKSILSVASISKNYIAMLVDIVGISFIPIYKPGRKCLVFCATKLMCTAVAKEMARAYPHITVRRYIGEDPMEHIAEGEILVSTTKSCGTAIDIPGLAISVMAEAINDTQTNQQNIKRLRDPEPGPDYFTPEFLYTLCVQISQHMNYHKRRVEIFKLMVKSHELLITDYRL